MKNLKQLLFVITMLVGFTGISQKYSKTENTNVSKKWNGNTFVSSKTFYENISEATDFSMLKRALENESLKNVIDKEEMVTIFAISNQGFVKYQEKQDSIFASENASKLTAIIKYHLVPGRLDSHSIKKGIKKNNGVAYFATLQGEKLGFKILNNQLVLIDSQGNTSLISATDFYHKNGFFHIVDGIVLPTK